MQITEGPFSPVGRLVVRRQRELAPRSQPEQENGVPTESSRTVTSSLADSEHANRGAGEAFQQ